MDAANAVSARAAVDCTGVGIFLVDALPIAADTLALRQNHAPDADATEADVQRGAVIAIQARVIVEEGLALSRERVAVIIGTHVAVVTDHRGTHAIILCARVPSRTRVTVVTLSAFCCGDGGARPVVALGLLAFSNVFQFIEALLVCRALRLRQVRENLHEFCNHLLGRGSLRAQVVRGIWFTRFRQV